ncbi:hypothetical protein SPURM210S_02544 [Streptomyces purpurascens]
MSSRVATPAVPPYSSITTAIVRLPESRSRSRSTASVSGTSSGSRISSETKIPVRRSAGTASTSLTCAVPTTESRVPRKTGKRDRPVARVALATSSRVACTSRATTCTRGVITFSAVRSARFSVRTNSSAVSRLQGALLGGVPGQCRELLRSACRGQLLGGLHTDPAHDPVRRVVEVGDEGPERGAEPALGVAHGLGDGQRRGDRPVLGNQFADHHQEHRRRGRAEHQREAVRRRPRDTHVLQRPGDQRGDRRLGEHADDQVRDGDAELRPGQLERQAPYGLQRALRAPLAALHRLLQLGALDRGEGELGRHEGAAGEREQDRRQKEEHFGHRFTPVPWFSRTGRNARCRARGGSPMGGRSQPFMQNRVAIQG